MAPDSEGLRIVRTWAGEGTGDRYYRTADGRVWEERCGYTAHDGCEYAHPVRGHMVLVRISTGRWECGEGVR